MSKTLEQVQSSDLSRNPLKVFTAAEKTPVIVTRRDGEDLVLMNKRETQNIDEFHIYVSQVLSALADNDGSLVERLAKPFPWILVFDEDGRTECANELVRSAKVAMATSVPTYALNQFNSWKGTAELLALGIQAEEVDWLNSPITASRP
jgi:hypothetical protein